MYGLSSFSPTYSEANQYLHRLHKTLTVTDETKNDTRRDLAGMYVWCFAAIFYHLYKFH